MPCSSSALFSYPPHSGILSHKPGLRVPRASASVSPFLSATFCPQPFHWLSLLLLEQPGLSHQGCPEGGGGLGTRSCLTLVTPWTVARQAPLSVEFSRQEYWSGWPFPSPGDLPDQGIEPGSPAVQANSTNGATRESLKCRRPRFNSCVRKIPWRRKCQLIPILLPGKFHGMRSLVGYSPWGCKSRTQLSN